MLPKLLVQFGDGSSHVPCFAEIIAENSWQVSTSSRFQRAHRTRERHRGRSTSSPCSSAFGDKVHVVPWKNLALMFDNSTFGFQSRIITLNEQPDASYRKHGITANLRTRAASAPCDIWTLFGFFRRLCNVMSEQDYDVVNVDTNQWCDKERCERGKKGLHQSHGAMELTSPECNMSLLQHNTVSRQHFTFSSSRRHFVW